MELGLRGKIAIVTGANQGIGRAIAEEFGAEGVRLAICARGIDLLQEVAADWMKDNPLKRPGEPHEVSALAAFLASERSSYINGVTVPIDGGAIRCI